jgi:hypothetical protein
MRTLVVGIPLPNASFDNYSFASAPSISEYRRLVVEMSSVCRVVGEIIESSAEHRTHGGQLVVNGPATDNRFALAELLEMRRREAEQFFARGGAAVCYAYPEMTFAGVEGFGQWRSYGWLPAPERFSYTSALLPGFGKEGAEALDVPHPFAAYIREFAGASRYRAYAEDAVISASGGTVLARSAGGFAIGFDVPAGAGRVVFAPPLMDPAKERQHIADAFLAAFEAINSQTPETAETTGPSELVAREVP